MTNERAILVETIRASFIDGVRTSVDVEIYEVCVGLAVADLRGFEIRTSTGYRATFPEAHTECGRTVCVKHGPFTAPTSESGTHCHGFHHIEQVRKVAREVAETYGSKVRNVAKPINVRISRVSQLTPKDWAATGWAAEMEVAA